MSIKTVTDPDAPTWQLPAHAAELMAIWGFPHGADLATDSLWWRSGDDGKIRLFADSSDFFDWGSADCEEIEETDMPLLRQCFDDLKKLEAKSETKCELAFLPELFVARKRKQAPMALWLERHMTKDFQELRGLLENPVHQSDENISS